MGEQNSEKLKVFISWSGNQSLALAEAIREWLPLVLHFVEPWLSKVDINAGQRWAEEIGNQLESTNFGLICVTRDNVESPWVHFEAGALAKSMTGGRVIPLLLNMEVRDIAGPLAQFQSKKVTKAGLFEVVESINLAFESKVPDSALRQLFEALWPKLESQVTRLPAPTTAINPRRNTEDILEDLVKSSNSLGARIQSIETSVVISLTTQIEQIYKLLTATTPKASDAVPKFLQRSSRRGALIRDLGDRLDSISAAIDQSKDRPDLVPLQNQLFECQRICEDYLGDPTLTKFDFLVLGDLRSRIPILQEKLNKRDTSFPDHG